MFGLEGIQGRHNGVITNSQNLSGSNDPKQVPNDATDVILKGAVRAAALRERSSGESTSLSPAELQLRRSKQRDAFGSRNRREFEWEQKQKTLRDEGFDVNSSVNDLMDYDDEAFAYGEDVEYNTYRDGRKITRADDEQTYRADDRGFTEDEETGQIRRETFEETRGSSEPIAPKSVMAKALAELQQGVNQYGYSALTGSADVEDRLIRQLQGGADLDYQRALVQELVEADAARFSPQMRAENDEAAGHLADTIARLGYTINGPGAMADEAIGRIAEIRKLGGAGVLAPAETAQVIRFRDDVNIPDAVAGPSTYIDPTTKNPIGIQGPQTLDNFLRYIYGPISADTAQRLNAPSQPTASSWILDNLPTPREEGRVFTPYPQTDITLATTNFAQKLRELDGYGLGNLSDNIRSTAELQKVTDYILRKSAAMGKPLYLKDEQGKNYRRANPGTEEVMQLLRLSDNEKQDLASALYQLETAQQSDANERYNNRVLHSTIGVAFDSPEGVEGNMAETTKLAKIPSGNTIIGPGGQRVGVRAALKQLNSPAAQKPLIGQVAPRLVRREDGKFEYTDERPRINRFKGKNMGSGDELAKNITAQAQSRATARSPFNPEKNRQNIIKARLVEEREKRDRKKRQQRENQTRAYTPANLRSPRRYENSDPVELEMQMREQAMLRREAKQEQERRRRMGR